MVLYIIAPPLRCYHLPRGYDKALAGSPQLKDVDGVPLPPVELAIYRVVIQPVLWPPLGLFASDIHPASLEIDSKDCG